MGEATTVRRSTASRAARGVALAVGLVGALLLGGCGGGVEERDLTGPDEGFPVEVGDPQTPGAAPQTGDAQPSDEDVIRAAIEDFYASGDPEAVCEQSATDPFIEDVYGDAEGCRAAVLDPGAAADDVLVTDVRIDGDRATAGAVPEGGPSGGLELEIELVKQGDRWRIDGIVSDAPPGP